jgi:hypothetical protein
MAHSLHARAAEPKHLVVVPEADHVNCVVKGGSSLSEQIGRFIRANCARN